LLAVIPAYSAKLSDSQELMQLLGVDRMALADLEQGKIVSFDVAEGKENELAAGVVMYLPASPSEIFRFLNKKGQAAVGKDIIAQRTIPVQATQERHSRDSVSVRKRGGKGIIRGQARKPI
jgi:hypothetical protein